MNKKRIFFTGDLHLGHENVLRFDNRPFASVEDMNHEIIQRWNKKVGPDDTVYVLGDMIWKTENNHAVKIIHSLNGQIILIKGNHDSFLRDKKAREALADVKDYDDIVVELEDGTPYRCILSRYFIPFYNGHRYGAIHLHAHSHTTEEAALELQIAEMLNEQNFKNKIYNVGCMYWDYEPVTLDEIFKNK